MGEAGDIGHAEGELLALGERTHGAQEGVDLAGAALRATQGDQPAEAEQVIEDVGGATVSGTSTECALIATHGLIQFRRGLIDDGRASYARAISRADELGLTHTRLQAMAYLAREEILAWTPTAKDALTNVLIALPEQSLSKAPIDLAAFVGRLRDRYNQQKVVSGPSNDARAVAG